MKPWITKNILESVKQRDKICKERIKAKNSQTKQLTFSLYKKYCNMVHLLKKSKVSHYSKYFEDNKKIVKQFGMVSMK